MKNDDILLAYIVGRGHSGSTLLELLLNRNKNIRAMGELDLFSLQLYRDHRTRWVGKCSCGERPYDCELWGKIINNVENDYQVDLSADPFSWRVSDVTLYEELDKPGIKESVRYKLQRTLRTFFYLFGAQLPYPLRNKYKEWVAHRDYLATSYAKLTKSKIVVDASKDHLHMKEIDLYSELPHKFIFLTRDVRGNAWSAIKGRGVSAKKEARDWATLNKRILKIISYIEESKYMIVRYEDLCKNTDATLDKIFNFLQVANDVVESDKEFSTRHTIAGNKIRFKKINEVRHDLSWEANLSDSDKSSILKEAGEIASRLGYTLHK